MHTLKGKKPEPNSFEVTVSAGHHESYTQRSSKKQKTSGHASKRERPESDSVVDIISASEDKDHEKSSTEPLSKKQKKTAAGISTVAINISGFNKSSHVETIEKEPGMMIYFYFIDFM